MNIALLSDIEEGVKAQIFCITYIVGVVKWNTDQRL